MDLEGINLLIASETNMNKSAIKSVCRHQSHYQVFSTETPVKGKKKGFGIAIFMNKEIGKHIYKQQECDAYGLALKLSFKGKHIINIVGLYYPPETEENKLTKLQVKKWVIKLLKKPHMKANGL